ncbi:ABC transporter substrate-binding protein [Teichococcus oryzae]|uniref:ABC transporter substrate-binding protein n=1 Tax=Teichococcus oryzae TaxID=1608942 RepID=A0A5B2TCB6_9PROT|nr:ABC transporter substrate-binding protein [Pseudoroseomonas oryzae]KAA2211488.1 ABC transporter substrate-binding protein [Pseudoroseomonas oryzae]
MASMLPARLGMPLRRQAARLLLQAAACALVLQAAATASPAAAQGERVLRYAASAEPRTLDPVVNWLSITHQHGYLVYDTLFSLDAALKPQPQMVGDVEKIVTGAGVRWLMTLRPGLAFHDGRPVAANDVIASIQRWAKRDVSGRKLVELGMALEVVDEKRFAVSLPVDTPLLIESFAKPTAAALFIMRAEDAATDPMTPVKEIIGSGPFRFDRAAYRPGDRMVYRRNTSYQPRQEPPSNFAGGKVAKIDRLEWLVLPDSASAVAALQSGELDIYETPPLDLLPVLARNSNVRVAVHGKQGQLGFLRPNHTQPPFDKPEARRALALLTDQREFMAITAGSEGQYWRECYSFLACGGLNENQAGSEWMRGARIEEAKRLFRQAGYAGQPIVVIAPGDNEIIKGFGTLAAERMRAAGLTVDLQYMDFATMMSRRNRREAPQAGGWNIFPMWSYGFELDNPIANVALSTNCTNASYAGWACSPRIEELKNAWARESDPSKRGALIADLQQEAAALVPIIPVGQFFAPIAYRTDVANFLETPVPVFWNVEKR